MKIKLDSGAVMPTRAHATDAGLDLYCVKPKLIWPWGHATFDTGVHMAFEPGTYGKVESKSGLNCNCEIVSCGGTIDEGYTGRITVKLYNLGWKFHRFRVGDKIAQLVIMPYLTPELEVVGELDETPRGNNGFGSTGR